MEALGLAKRPPEDGEGREGAAEVDPAGDEKPAAAREEDKDKDKDRPKKDGKKKSADDDAAKGKKRKKGKREVEG
jgi:hypothetical protein